MKQTNDSSRRVRARERGGARLNLLLVLAVIAAAAYAGAQYVPVAYRARTFKAFMQDTVDTAGVADKPPAWVEEQLRRNFENHDVPEDATVKVARNGRRVEATVRYTQPVPLFFTEYEFEFDETVRSTNVLGP